MPAEKEPEPKQTPQWEVRLHPQVATGPMWPPFDFIVEATTENQLRTKLASREVLGFIKPNPTAVDRSLRPAVVYINGQYQYATWRKL
jgi:hypothetical protein